MCNLNVYIYKCQRSCAQTSVGGKKLGRTHIVVYFDAKASKLSICTDAAARKETLCQHITKQTTRSRAIYTWPIRHRAVHYIAGCCCFVLDNLHRTLSMSGGGLCGWGRRNFEACSFVLGRLPMSIFTSTIQWSHYQQYSEPICKQHTLLVDDCVAGSCNVGLFFCIRNSAMG